jgi:hypothetical protein
MWQREQFSIWVGGDSSMVIPPVFFESNFSIVSRSFDSSREESHPKGIEDKAKTSRPKAQGQNEVGSSQEPGPSVTWLDRER